MAADDDTFTAEQAGPPRRQFWITRDPAEGPVGSVRGWSFIYDQMGDDGEWTTGWDTWEEWFFEILRYPPTYAAQPLEWRRESTGERVDLQSLQPLFDGKPVSSDETPESAGLR